MVWPLSGLPPKSSLAPGICSNRCVCASMASVVQVSTGPMVRSCVGGSRAEGWMEEGLGWAGCLVGRAGLGWQGGLGKAGGRAGLGWRAGWARLAGGQAGGQAG